MTSLAEKILAVHQSLDAAGFRHAFGGALALAWCTRQPRGTSDIDVNVFVPADRADAVIEALPPGVVVAAERVSELRDTGQCRVTWEGTPVDLFLSTTAFHDEACERATLEPFGGAMVPFLSCTDLAVFKAFFDRRRDWADLEAMLLAGTVDVGAASVVLTGYLGPEDRRIRTLEELARETAEVSAEARDAQD
jgi:hypothetical protein